MWYLLCNCRWSLLSYCTIEARILCGLKSLWNRRPTWSRCCTTTQFCLWMIWSNSTAFWIPCRCSANLPKHLWACLYSGSDPDCNSWTSWAGISPRCLILCRETGEINCPSNSTPNQCPFWLGRSWMTAVRCCRFKICISWMCLTNRQSP